QYLVKYSNLSIKLGGILSPLIAPSFYIYNDASFTNNIPLKKSIAHYIVFFTYSPIL
ncbi:hypothetical protein QR685DRAFT_432460, partial [Neurospora intermedia]